MSKKENLVYILGGTAAIIGTVLLIRHSDKQKSSGSGSSGGGTKKGVLQNYINYMLGIPAIVYELQTMKPGGAHGQPGTAAEQKKRIYDGAIADLNNGGSSTWLNATGSIPGVDEMSYPGVPFGNAADSPAPSGGGGGDIGGVVKDIIGLGTTVAAFI